MTAQPIAILGSTGSVGVSALTVVDRYPERLRVAALAGGANAKLLAEQALRYQPEIVALADSSQEESFRAALGGYRGRTAIGPEGVLEAAAWSSVRTAVIAIVGFAGVRPTLAAIEAGKNIALANKESLVTAGSLIMPLAVKRGLEIAPIDSEHSAIWQCLRAGEGREVRRLILTASGGPFRARPIGDFDSITPEEALAHPTWKMGARITIDSATMMNKGFEVIEAARLFGVGSEQIDVVLHPQSIVHSMVEFQDASIIAQLGPTDMTLPIAYALFAPERPPAAATTPMLDPVSMGVLEFSPLDGDRFPALALARQALTTGGTAPAVLNAADEAAVAAFLDRRISFPRITGLIEEALAEHLVVSEPDIDDISDADRWARSFVNERLDSPYQSTGVKGHDSPVSNRGQ